MLRYWVFLGTSIALVAAAAAQDVVTFAATEEPIIDPAATTTRPDTGEDPEFQRLADGLAPAADRAATPADLGTGAPNMTLERRWRIIPYGRTIALWDDNIFISNTNRQSDFFFSLSPGLAFGWGDYASEAALIGSNALYYNNLLQSNADPGSYLFARYNPNFNFFLENDTLNDITQDAAIAARWVGRRSMIGLRASYQTLSGTNVDVGNRVDRTVINAGVNAKYFVSDKTLLEVNVLGLVNDFPTDVSWEETRLETYLDYQVLPKTRLGIGGLFGALWVQDFDPQIFQQVLTRVTYSASAKLGFIINGGLEFRQFPSGDDRTFGVFDIGATYQPFDGTTFDLRASRRNSASVALVDETITSTGISARVTQRFLRKLQLAVEGGYQLAEYEPSVAGAGIGRSDDNLFVRSSVSMQVTKYLRAEAAYNFQTNDSTFEPNSFYANNLSLQLSLQF